VNVIVLVTVGVNTRQNPICWLLAIAPVATLTHVLPLESVTGVAANVVPNWTPMTHNIVMPVMLTEAVATELTDDVAVADLVTTVIS